MIDKVKAKELREQGLAYTEIATILDCSVIWCKKNLRGVSKNQPEQAMISSVLVPLAQSNSMLTNGQIRKEVRTIYPNDFTKAQQDREDASMQRVRTKVKQSKGAMVRPYWMLPTASLAVLYSVIREAQAMDDRMQEAIDVLRSEHSMDETYVKSLRYAINDLTLAGTNSEPLQSKIDRLESIAIELCRRNPGSDSTKILPHHIVQIDSVDVPY